MCNGNKIHCILQPGAESKFDAYFNAILLRELDTMKQLKPHPHVIKLLGCVRETGKLFISIEIPISLT